MPQSSAARLRGGEDTAAGRPHRGGTLAQQPRRRAAAVAIATVVDKAMWTKAAVFVQQLVGLGTRLPVVIFNVSALPSVALALLHVLGATVSSLEPSMPIPEEFGSRLLSWPFSTADGRPLLGRIAPWAKLAVWGQTQWDKVILVDVDVVLLDRIDEMADFPANTFSPEVCNSISPARCSDVVRETTMGFNAGVMVVGPSTERFSSMSDFATQKIVGLLRACVNRSQADNVERRYLAYPEQSFLKQYWPAVMGGTIEGGGGMRWGYDWQWRTLKGKCAPDAAAGCTPPESHFMSRVYNARAHDCGYCSAKYVRKVKIVHYTCGYKPWHRTREGWARCSQGNCKDLAACAANWTLLWHEARDQVCARAEAMGIAREDAGCARL